MTDKLMMICNNCAQHHVWAAGSGRPFSASEVHRRGPHWDGSSAAEMLKQVR